MRCRIALVMSVFAAATACGGGSSGGATATGPTYSSPTAMLTALQAGGVTCDTQGDDTPQSNEFGALSLSCFYGSQQESVYLDTFPTAGAKTAEQNGLPAQDVSYFGPNWAVTAESPTTLATLKAALVK